MHKVRRFSGVIFLALLGVAASARRPSLRWRWVAGWHMEFIAWWFPAMRSLRYFQLLGWFSGRLHETHEKTTFNRRSENIPDWKPLLIFACNRRGPGSLWCPKRVSSSRSVEAIDSYGVVGQIETNPCWSSISGTMQIMERALYSLEL